VPAAPLAPQVAPSAPRRPGSSGYLLAHNVMRNKDPLKADMDLEAIASKTLDNLLAEGCRVTASGEMEFAKGHGVNTLAMQNCSHNCSWADVVNSWAAEKGSKACEVAHRATLLNPQATKVGCALENSDACMLAVCVYDKEVNEADALSIAQKSEAPPCDAAACCGKLPCSNTLC
jgi:hypothetical protein